MKILLLVTFTFVFLRAEQLWSGRWNFNPTQGKLNELVRSNYRFNTNFVWPFAPVYLPSIIATSTFTTTQIVTVPYINTIENYCIAGAAAVCPARRRRSHADEEGFVFMDGKPFRPSQVSRMLMTAMPAIISDRSNSISRVPELEASISSRSGNARVGIRRKGQWFYATTVTVTLQDVTIVNYTLPVVNPITVSGCIPPCLTTLALC